MMPRSLREQLRICRHFTGTANPACAAGVSYAAVEQPRLASGQRRRLPCLGDVDTHCDQCSMPTDAEIDTEIAQAAKRFENYTAARAAIVAQAAGQRHVRGKIHCPVCGDGALRYAIAGNGHIHAACSTEGCVSWME